MFYCVGKISDLPRQNKHKLLFSRAGFLAVYSIWGMLTMKSAKSERKQFNTTLYLVSGTTLVFFFVNVGPGTNATNNIKKNILNRDLVPVLEYEKNLIFHLLK